MTAPNAQRAAELLEESRKQFFEEGNFLENKLDMNVTDDELEWMRNNITLVQHDPTA